MTLAFAPKRIETWPLSRLRPYAKNATAHGADQVAKIAASMAEFGWTVPSLVGDRELIVGHGRKLTELGAWDEALLSAELNELLAEDFALSLVGFSDSELDKLLALCPKAKVRKVAASARRR